MNHLGTVTLTTPRLVLRRFTVDDAEAAFANYASDEKTTRFMHWAPYTQVEPLREFLVQWASQYDDVRYYHWAIVFEDEVIGAINLHGIADNSSRAELGYNLGSRWWNQGLATEAVGAVLDFAFGQMGAERIVALHDCNNPASGRVMAKNGMKQEGLLRKHLTRREGGLYDCAYYGILRDEWLAQRGTVGGTF